MKGKVFIKDLLVRFQIGINAEEKREPQDILINVEFVTDPAEAIESDDINKTVDYRPVYYHILELTKTSQFNLIETLANTIADYSLAFNNRVQQVVVKIEKPHRFNFLQSVGVEIVRSRE